MERGKEVEGQGRKCEYRIYATKIKSALSNIFDLFSMRRLSSWMIDKYDHQNHFMYMCTIFNPVELTTIDISGKRCFLYYFSTSVQLVHFFSLPCCCFLFVNVVSLKTYQSFLCVQFFLYLLLIQFFHVDRN